MACLLLAGCGGHAVPTLKVREVHSWALPADGPALPAPRSVAIAGTELVVVDKAGRILVYGPGARLLRQWRMPETSVGKPEGVCILNDGRIVVCDTHYHRIIYFDSQGRVLTQIGTMGNGPGQFIYPVGITKDAKENLYICEYGGNDRVQKFTRDGVFLKSFGKFGTGPSDFQRPSGLAWHDGKLYVADAINNRVQVYTDEGGFLGVLGANGALDLPYGVAWNEESLYVIEYGAGRLTRLDPATGAVLGRFGSAGAGDGQFGTPWGLALSADGRGLWVADTENRRLVELDF